MADYKEMYLKMMRASEEAIRILIFPGRPGAVPYRLRE